MKKVFLFITLYLIASAGVPLFSQARAYKSFMERGEAAFQADDFDTAKKQFKAALECSGLSSRQKREAEKWMDDAREGHVEALKKAREEERKARTEAEAAKEKAEKSRDEAVSMLSALQSGIALENDSLEKALQLAFEAKSNLPDTVIQAVEKSFGDVVYQRTARNLFSASKGESSRISRLCFSPEGNLILAAGQDNKVLLVDYSDGKVTDIGLHPGVILSIAFSAGGDKVAVGGKDGTLKVWRKDKTLLLDKQAHEAAILSVAFFQDDQKILTASRDHTAKIWDLQGNLLSTLEGHRAPVRQASCSKSGRRLLTRSSDGALFLWDSKGELIKRLDQGAAEKYAHDVSFSSDGKHVAAGWIDGSVTIWDEGGAVQKTTKAHEGAVISVFFLPNNQLVSASVDLTIRVWNKDGEIPRYFRLPKMPSFVSLSPDGKKLLAGMQDGVAHVYDLDENLLVMRLPGHGPPIKHLELSKNGNFILILSEDGVARICRTADSIYREMLSQ